MAKLISPFQVLSLYKDLNLKKNLQSHIEEKQRDVVSRIQQISKVDDKTGVSQEFFFKLIDWMDVLDLAQLAQGGNK